MRLRNLMRWGALLLALVPAMILALAWGRVLANGDGPSRSIGTVSAGSLEGGRALPPWGRGFTSYSLIGSAVGRQYVHGAVADTLEAAFAELAHQPPGHVYVVGETGWRSGGSFRPHRTHQSGMSVDIFVPLLAATGEATRIPTAPWYRFGYGVELDELGRLGDGRIDFEALAALLLALDRQGREHEVRIGKIILAPEYAAPLLATPSGRRFGRLAKRLVRRPVWVRHDDHVHVDFVTGG